MRGTNRFELKLFVLGLVVALSSCNSTNLDNGSSADSILTVFNIPTVPPITATADTANVCNQFTVTPMTVTLKNAGKSELAGTSPFNDIVLDTVELNYAWDDGAPPTVPNPVTFPVGGTVPAGATGTVSFPPIAGGNLDPSRAGHSASVHMQFRGHTVAGDAVSATGGTVLTVNSCATGGNNTPCVPVGSDVDGDGLLCPNDVCPNCNDVNCTGTSGVRSCSAIGAVACPVCP